jgi:hypothetical protein
MIRTRKIKPIASAPTKADFDEVKARFDEKGAPWKAYDDPLISEALRVASLIHRKAETAARTRGAVRGTLVGVRLQPDLLKRLDAYAGLLSRPEAIRMLVEAALANQSSRRSS